MVSRQQPCECNVSRNSGSDQLQKVQAGVRRASRVSRRYSSVLAECGGACPPHFSPCPVISKDKHTQPHTPGSRLDTRLTPYSLTRPAAAWLCKTSPQQKHKHQLLSRRSHYHTHKSKTQHTCHTPDSAAYQIRNHGNPPGVRLQSGCLNSFPHRSGCARSGKAH